MLGAGQAALETGDWEAARSHFEAAVAEAPSAEALEGLGSAYFWVDHRDTIEVRERGSAPTGLAATPVGPRGRRSRWRSTC